MTFLQMQQLATDWLDDPQNGYFTLNMMKIRLNLAQKEVEKILATFNQQLSIKSATTSTVAGQEAYVLPTDFQALERLEIETSGSGVNAARSPIEPSTRHETSHLSGTGLPSYFYFEGNHLILRKTPDSAKVMRLAYRRRLADMVLDTDVSAIPEEYHEMIVLVVVLDGLVKDDRVMTNLTNKMTLYMDTLKKDAQNRQKMQPRQVSSGYR